MALNAVSDGGIHNNPPSIVISFLDPLVMVSDVPSTNSAWKL